MTSTVATQNWTFCIFAGEHNILLDWKKVLGDQSYWDLGYDQRVRVMMTGDNFYKDPDNDYMMIQRWWEQPF